MDTRINQILNSINVYVFSLFILLLPFNLVINRYVLVLMVISSFFIFKKEHFFKLHKTVIIILGNIIVFYLFTLLSLSWTENMQIGINRVVTFATFILIPLGIFLSAENIKQRKKWFYIFFIGGNFLASITCLIQSFINSYKEVNGVNIFDHRVYSISHLNNLEAIISGYSEFSYGYLSFLMHPSYFSLYITTATLFVFSLILICKSKMIRIGLVGLVIWFTLFQGLLATRIGYFLQFMVVLFIIYYLLKKKHKIYFSILVVVTVIMLGFLFNSQSRFKNTVSGISLLFNENKTAYQERNVDKRILIWNEALEFAVENQPFGAGIGDFDVELQKRFENKGYKQFSNFTYNAHNQYIESLGGLGILGLLLLLYFIFYPLFIFYKRKEGIPFLMVLLIALSLLFESMLLRLQGIVFISFFVFVHFIFKMKKETNNV